MVNIVGISIAIYLLLGAVFLIVLEHKFPKVWHRLRNEAHVDLHERVRDMPLTGQGIPWLMPFWLAKVVISISAYLGWIFILIGMLLGKYESRKR